MSSIGWEPPRNTNPLGRRSSAVRTAAALAAVALLPTATRAADVVSTWKLNTNGNWSDPTKWSNTPAVTAFPSNGQLGNVYDVVLNSATAAVTLDRTITLRDLTLNSGSIRPPWAYPQTHGTNTLTVTNTFTFASGAASVPIRVLSSGRVVFSDPSATKTIGRLNIGGTVSFAPSSGTYTLSAAGLSRLEIETTATLTLPQSLSLRTTNVDPVFGYMNGGELYNYGAIDLPAGADLLSYWNFHNAGTVRVNGVANLTHFRPSGGLLDLQSASARVTVKEPTALTGSIRLAEGSAFTLAGGTRSSPNEIRNLSVTNAGSFTISGDLRISTPTTIPGVVQFGVPVGQLTLDADLSLTGPATIASLISGTGRLGATNLTLRGGLRDATVHIPAGGALQIAGAGDQFLAGAILEIDGTANWGSRTLISSATAGARLDIRPGGTLTVQGTSWAELRGYHREPTSRAVLNNAGMFAVEGVNTFLVSEHWDLVNTGTMRFTDASNVSVRPGSLAISGGTLDLRGRTYTTIAPVEKFDISVAAQVLVGSSSALIASPTNAGLIQVDRGGSLNAQSLFNSGTVRIAGGSYSGARFTNSGTIDLDAGDVATISGGSFQNFSVISPTGRMRIGPSASASFSGSSSNTSLANAGTISVEGGRLTVNVMTANAGAIRVTAGTFEFGNQWYSGLTNSGSIEIGSGGVATIGHNGQLVVTPSGIVRINAGGVLNVSSGIYSSAQPFVVEGDVGVNGGRLLVTTPLNNSGTIRIAAGVARFGSPSFTNTGTIDLRPEGFALLTFGNITQSLATARAQVLSGYNGGTWDGKGILSTDAQSDSSLAVGFALARDLSPAVRQRLGNYDYLDVALRLTRYGDTTLDGLVDFTDLVRLAQNYNAANRTWGDGDFTYDGVVDFNDLVKLAQNYNTALQPAAVPGAPHSFHEDLTRAFVTVPEPTALPLLAPAACGLASRRRRTRKAYTNS